MRTIIRTTRLPAVCVLLSLTGCVSLGRDSPALEQYVLGRAAAVEVTPQPTTAGVTIGLRRADVAAYLAIPAIVVRHGTHRIVTSDFHRWAEDPGTGINRAVARYLAAAGGVGAVDVAPWPARSAHDYLVQLHVIRFEGVVPEGVVPGEVVAGDVATVTGEVHMQVEWELIRPVDGALLARGATDFRQPGWTVGDYAALVALLDRGLTVLAADLAARIGSLEQ